MVAYPEDIHGLGQLALTIRRECSAVALEVLEFLGDHLAEFTPGAGENRHGSAGIHESRNRAARRDGLVVGMGVHEQHPLEPPVFCIHSGQDILSPLK